MKRCGWDELPGYTSSSAKQLQFCCQDCKSSVITKFPSGGKLAQKSIKPSEVSKWRSWISVNPTSTPPPPQLPSINAEPSAKQLTEIMSLPKVDFRGINKAQG